MNRVEKLAAALYVAVGLIVLVLIGYVYYLTGYTPLIEWAAAAYAGYLVLFAATFLYIRSRRKARAAAGAGQ